MLRLYSRGIFFIHEYLVWVISMETECKIPPKCKIDAFHLFASVWQSQGNHQN